MESTKPPRFFFDRKTIGIMETSLDVLDGMTIGGVAGAGSSAFFSEPVVTTILALITILLQLLKLGLRSILLRALPRNPINTTEHTTVEQPAPIVPTGTTDGN